MTHTRLSTYSGVINHPTAPIEVKQFFHAEALSSALNVMRAAIQGESRLKSMPNNTVIMIAFAACSALSLSLTGGPGKKNRHNNRLAPSVLNLIKETADVLERIGATPSHRNGASVLYGRFMRDLVSRAYNYSSEDRYQHPRPTYSFNSPFSSEHINSGNNNFNNKYHPTESIPATSLPYTPHHPHITPSTQPATLAFPETLQFSSMSGDQIIDAVNNAGLSLGESLPDHQGFPLNEMMPWDWFDYNDIEFGHMGQ